jgi:DNA-binding ferritin-like protein (Dps family)
MTMSNARTSIAKVAARLIGDKRRWWQYKARTRKLPEHYRAAAEALERYLMVFGPTDGDSAMSMFDDLAEMFEQGVANGTSVRALVGEDPLEFAEAFLANYPEGWMSTERRRLANAIDRAAGDRPEQGGRAV